MKVSLGQRLARVLLALVWLYVVYLAVGAVVYFATATVLPGLDAFAPGPRGVQTLPFFGRVGKPRNTTREAAMKAGRTGAGQAEDKMKRRFDWSAAAQAATSQRHVLLLVLICSSMVIIGCAPYASGTKASASAISVDAAVLGGTPRAFTATYGHPFALDQVYKYVAPTGEQVILWLNVVSSIPERGPRVVQLFIGPSNHQPWDATTAERLYRAFFPADAVHLRDVGTAHGTHHLFRSAALAATLPFTFFVDQHGQSLDPGTFDAVCAAGDAAQPSGFACFVAAGMIAV